MAKKRRKTRPWLFDPSLFQPIPKSSFLEHHVLVPARSAAKYSLFTLAFAYPLLLIIIGVIFGGLVFWIGLVGSMGLIGVIIKKGGYASNFASWDISHKKFLGALIGYGIWLAVVYGLIYTPLKFLTIPLLAGILTLIILVVVWRTPNQKNR